MKYTRLLSVSGMLAFSALALSCGSDDGFDASIIGKWNYSKTITTINNGSPNTQNYEGNTIGCDKDYQQFADGGVYRDVVLFKNEDQICTESVETDVYAKNGDQLTIGETTYTVTKLTDTELRYASTVVNGAVSVKVENVFRRK